MWSKIVNEINHPNIGSNTQGVVSNQRRKPWTPTTQPSQPHGTKLPFFCVHGAGGDVLWYKELAHLLGPNQPFYGIESPGLEDRQEPDLPLEALASFYLESVRSVQASGPYALGGYSMGGVVAFEIARQLQAQGESVAPLAILDAWSPGSHLPFSPNRCASSAALSNLIARRK